MPWSSAMMHCQVSTSLQPDLPAAHDAYIVVVMRSRVHRVGGNDAHSTASTSRAQSTDGKPGTDRDLARLNQISQLRSVEYRNATRSLARSYLHGC
nr:hypothetical protein CFP56_53670 [Quercus suber]